MNQKIVLITYIEKDPKSPYYKAKMVSHGENLNIYGVALKCQPPSF